MWQIPLISPFVRDIVSAFMPKQQKTEAPKVTQPQALSAPVDSGPTVQLQNTGGGTGYSAPAGPSAASVNPLLASLAQLDPILQNKLSGAEQTYNRYIGQYDTQDALDKAAYEANQQKIAENLAGQRQTGLLNAVRGGEGLRAVLSSLGALAGSGENVVRRLVGLAANSDLGAADKTFATNTENLTQSWQNAEQAQRQRRIDAEAQRQADIQNAQADVLGSRQKILESLANLYGADTSRGQQYASQATSLAPQIAATTAPSVGRYAAPSSLFSPAAIQNYLAGTKNLSVSTDGASNTPINSPLYSSEKRKDNLPTVA